MDIYDQYLDSDIMDWDEFQETPAPPPTHEADSMDAYLDSDIMDWDEFQATTAPPAKKPEEAEPIYAELGLPVPSGRFGKRPEEYTEEMTAKRLGKQALISAGQGVADIGRFAKATAETRKLDDPMPFPEYTGWERDPARPQPGPYRGAMDIAAVMTYDQRQFGSILRGIAETEGVDPTPDRMDEEWQKYQQSKQTAAIQGAQDFIDMFPEIMEGSSGLTEDALTGMARFAPTMGISAANPFAGTLMTFAQIAGSSYDDYRKQGIDPEKAFNVAVINSLVQTPLEMAGNLLQIRALRNVTKSLGRSVGVGARLERFGGALITGAVGEGAEEFLQQYPDEISNIYLANPDLTPEEVAQEVWKQAPEITKKGTKAMVVGGYGGLMLAGGVQTLAIPTDLSSYISEKQRKINKEKGITPEVIPPEDAAPPIEEVRAKYKDGTFTVEDLEDYKEIFGDDADFVAGIDEILKPTPAPTKETPFTEEVEMEAVEPAVKAVPEEDLRTRLLAKLKKDRPDIGPDQAAAIVDDTIARTEEFIPIEEEAEQAEFSVAMAKEEGTVLPGSAAIKIRGKVYGPAQTHLQVLGEIPTDALEPFLGEMEAQEFEKNVMHGFLTDKGVFVDRKKALTLVPPAVAKGKKELVSEDFAEFSMAPEDMAAFDFKAEDIDALRKATVKRALAEGKVVPEEVLKDYPDLQAKEPARKAPSVPKLSLKRHSPGLYSGKIGNTSVQLYRAESGKYWSSTITVGEYGSAEYVEEIIQGESKRGVLKDINKFIESLVSPAKAVEPAEFSIAPAKAEDIKAELKLTQFKRQAPEDSYAIREGRKRVGHIVGESSEVYTTSNILKDNPDLGLKAGDTYYRIANTRLEEEHRGKGIYQEKIQEIANKYDAGALVHKFEASTALQKALRKIPGVVENDSIILIPPTRAELKIEERDRRFDDLAEQQRGKPEAAMHKATMRMGGGVMQETLEHAGDIIHRMSQKPWHGKGYYDLVKPKINLVHKRLHADYGFEKEFRENIKENAKGAGTTPANLQKEVDSLLLTYAKEHGKLPAYNEMHHLANDLNVALGEQRYDDARYFIDQLKKNIDKGEAHWEKVALGDVAPAPVKKVVKKPAKVVKAPAKVVKKTMEELEPAEFSVAVAAEAKITGKKKQKDVKRTLTLIEGGKYEYIEKRQRRVLEQAEFVREEDAKTEAAAQIVTIKNDRFPQQTISTVVEAQAWLKENGFPQIAKKGETAKLIERLVKDENFQKLNIFDRTRVAAQLERVIREYDYKPVIAIGGNAKTKGLLGTKGIGEIEIIGGSGIRIADCVAGCDHYCFECYALKGAAQGQKCHQHPVLAKLTSYLKTGEVLRIGEKGDPSRAWGHTNEQIRLMLARSEKRKQDVSPDNIYFTTKLLNLEGFDPKINRHLQVTLDPLFPDHMIRTMENILRVKSAHPEVVIVTRIRSIHTTNKDLNESTQAAVEFANQYNIPILETRMRFIRKSSFDVLELKKEKYKYDGTQYKMTSPALKEESEDYHLCDVKDKSCPACKNCVKLVQSRKKIIPKQLKAIRAAGIDGVRIEDSQAFDPVGLTAEGKVPEFSLHTDQSETRTSAREVIDRIIPILRSWANFPTVRVVQSVDELPRGLRRQTMAQERKTKGKVEGMYDPNTDQVFLIADNLAKGRIEDVLRHEAEGHRGLRLLMGSGLDSFLDKVAAEKKADLQAMFPGLNFKSKAAVRSAANEWASRQIEAGTMKPLWHGRLVHAFKQWLRKLVPNLKLTDADIRIILHDVVMNVRRGAPQQILTEQQKATALGSEKVMLWQSQMVNVFKQKLPGKGTPESFIQTIDAFVKKGEFKEEELEWSGVRAWLKGQKGKISKQDVLDYLATENVRVDEVEKGSRHHNTASKIMSDLEKLGYEIEFDRDIETGQETPTEIHHERTGTSFEFPLSVGDKMYINNNLPPEDRKLIEGLENNARLARADDTKFGEYVLSGGENYRELLLTMPRRDTVPVIEWEINPLRGPKKGSLEHVAEYDGERYVISRLGPGEYRSRHIPQATLSPVTIATTSSVDAAKRSVVDYATDIPPTFKSSHWDEENVIAHIRFDERRAGPPYKVTVKDRAGKSTVTFDALKEAEEFVSVKEKGGFTATIQPTGKVLHIAEIQSDWHQEGRAAGYERRLRKDEIEAKYFKSAVPEGHDPGNYPGYWESRDKNTGKLITRHGGGMTEAAVIEEARSLTSHVRVPDAPFKKTWPLLTVKRMVRYAAENGYDTVTWDTGQIQGDRYDLSKQVDSIRYQSHLTANLFDVEIIKNRDVVVEKTSLSPEELERLVGKEITERIVKDTGEEVEAEDGQTWLELKGLDLEVGGEGMINFYDKLLPNVVNKFFNKTAWGKAKVGTLEFEEGTTGLAPRKYKGPEISKARLEKDRDEGVHDSPALHKQVRQIALEMKTGVSFKDAMTEYGSIRLAEFYGGSLISEYKEATVHALTITPEMKTKAIHEGMPLFSVKADLTDRQRKLLEKHYPEKLAAMDKKAGGTIIEESKEGYADAAEMGEIPSNPEGFNMPHEGVGRQVFDLIQFKVQDRLNSLRKVQATIEKQTTTEIPEAANGYQTEELYHGKVSERVGTFDSEHVDPLVEAIHESGFELEEVEAYLYARHAKEANAQLEKINPKVKDNKALSGLSNEDAAVILEQYAGNKAMQDIAARVDAITKAGRQILVKEGLATSAEIAAWENVYDNYIPLKREGKDLTLPKRGQGINIAGPEGKRRLTGSAERQAVNILANVVSQHEAIIIRAEKVKVGRAMLKLAEAFPNKELWEVDAKQIKPFLKQRSSQEIDPETGLPQTLNEVVLGRDVLYKLNDNVLVVKVDGKERTITFNEKNVHAQRIVRSLKNLGAQDMSAFVSTLSKVNRWLAIVNTSANPEFIISNFARDIQTAGYNISDTAAKNMKRKVFKDVFRSLQGIRRGIRGDFTSEWAQEYKNFVKAGAQTGWTDHYKNIESREKSLKKQLDLMKDGTFRSMKRGAKGLMDFVSNENTAVENAIRLSVYKHLKDAGASDATAASAAKNLTVNFNRRGDMGQTLNAMYLFFNANVQGSARLIYAAARSPKVRRMMYGTVAFAVMLDILNRAIGGEDDDGENRYDKVPPWVKEHNLVLMRPNGDYFKVPLPWGYNTLHVLGQSIGEAVDPKADDFDTAAAALRFGSAVLGSFNPLGSESTLLQLAAPTIADPFVQWAQNKNFAGIPIKPEQMPFDVPKPEYQLYFQSARKPSRWIAKMFNDLTGGDEIRPGFGNVSPEVIDLFLETMMGGAGRFMENTLALPAEFAKKKPEVRKMPGLRKIYGEAPDYYLRTKFYDNLSEIRYAQKSVDHYEDNPARLSAVKREYSWESRFIKRAKRDKKKIGDLRKKRKKIEAGTESERVKEAKLQAIEKQITQIMTAFNRTYKRRTGGAYMTTTPSMGAPYTPSTGLTLREAMQIK